MAKKIQQLDTATSVKGVDVIPVVINPTTLPSDRKITLDSLFINGWFLASEVWTYASASTFTVLGDVTSKYKKGMKIKLDQSAATKYFYVVNSTYSAPNTTVTITGGSDYTLANVAISENYYSNADSPTGFPQWFNWNPTIVGFSSLPPGVYRFNIIQRTVFFNIDQTTNGTSNSTVFSITLPVDSAAVSGGLSSLTVDNSVVLTTPGRWFVNANSNVLFLNKDAATTTYTASGGKRARVQGFYEI